MGETRTSAAPSADPWNAVQRLFIGEAQAQENVCPPEVTVESLSSSNALESLIPFYTPDEVEICDRYLEAAAKGAPGCPPMEATKKKAVEDACANIRGVHRELGMTKKLLLFLALAIAIVIRSKRGGGPPPASGGKGASGSGSASPTPSGTRPSSDELDAGRRVRGKGARSAEPVRMGDRLLNPDQVWGDSPNAIPMGWIGFGAIPHTRLEPGTRFIMKAIQAARQASPSREAGNPFQVVEVGTNLGILAELVAKRFGVRVLATDVKDVSAFNGEHAPLVHFRRASALSLPLDDGGADAYMSSFTWEYAGPRALDEAFRVLPPGGTFVAVSHYRDSTTSRSIVSSGRMLKRIIEMAAMPRGSDKKSKAYQRILADLAAGQGIEGNMLERAANRRALPHQARGAFLGTLPPKWLSALDLMAVAGQQLEWIMQLSEEEIRRVFEDHGFEVVEMRPVHFRPLGGLIPVSSHQGLGIVARRRADGEAHDDPKGATAPTPASSGGNGVSARASGGKKDSRTASRRSLLGGIVIEAEGATAPAQQAPFTESEKGASSGRTILSGGEFFFGGASSPLMTMPAAAMVPWPGMAAM